jgi:hypothetical protein
MGGRFHWNTHQNTVAEKAGVEQGRFDRAQGLGAIQ